MSATNNGKVLKGRDLITIGIFSALYFVINFAFMLVSGLHPLLWILMPELIALFAGIPFLLMCAKVQKPGAVLLMGLITGLIYFATGQFTLIILIIFVIGCGLGELIRACTHYHSFKGNALAYAGFSLGMIGAVLTKGMFNFPAIKEETGYIRDAMRLRNIRGLQKAEALIVPLKDSLRQPFCW